MVESRAAALWLLTPVALFFGSFHGAPAPQAAGTTPAQAVTAAHGGPPPSDAPWDISAPHADARTLRFETDEGTWTQLDLHPSGDRLVFDLLGDLYTVPAGGGRATPLRTGAAWEIEPRFSPDGARLLFTSDRSGVDTVWLSAADGSGARPLVEMADARVTDAAWAPDGSGAVVRVRKTDTSSIGVHELWWVPIDGGKGIPLTSTDQAAGYTEPAVSPDGRYVYAATRGARYAYDRDPHQGIWQIVRIDRKTGTHRPVTQDAGGAARPTPSPDGRILAYVRRRGAQTVLSLLDLETGARTDLADWLDRDAQEGFATHGLYPRMVWTKDGAALYVSAGGTIHRVERASGEHREVRYVVEAEHRIESAVRPQRAAVSDSVQARILRWPTMAGGALVVHALSVLWRIDAPGAAPRPLVEHGGKGRAPTSPGPSTPREYAPAVAPDGKTLVYVSWTDAEGGALHLLPSGAGRPRDLGVRGPRWSNPSFAPDGKSVVALRGRGAERRGADFGGDLGAEVVIVDVATGLARVVADTRADLRAARPQFSPDGRRVLFPEEVEQGTGKVRKLMVWSHNLDGSDRRPVLDLGDATEAHFSPDFRFLGVQRAHHAYVVALPSVGGDLPRAPSGGPLELGAEGPLPTLRLSEDHGAWIGFDPTSTRVHWVEGPEVHDVALADVLALNQARAAWESRKADAVRTSAAFTETAPADRVIPRRWTPQIVLPRSRPPGLLLVTNARVITFRSAEGGLQPVVLEDHDVLVRGDRIEAVGRDLRAPAGAPTLDATGLSLYPGLIDVHGHLHYTTADVMPQQPWRHLANLAYGVTTVHDPSAADEEVFSYAEWIEAGIAKGPRTFSTGYILYGASGAERSAVGSAADALRHVRRQQSKGAISVKSYQQPERRQRQWIVAAARERGVLVVPEGGGDLQQDLTMVLDGHSAIEHALPVAPLRKDVVSLLAASGTWYTPTLLVSYATLSGEQYFRARDDVSRDLKLARFYPPDALLRYRRKEVVAPEDDHGFLQIAASAAAIQRAGGHVTLGAHGQVQGLGAHWELQALASPGAMAPLDALRAATIDGAAYLGMQGDLGSIDVGKLADFVICDGRPDERVEDAARIRWVIKNGEVVEGREP